MRNAAGAIHTGDAHTFADTEHFVRLNFLNVGAHAAIVFAHGDFHALGAGQAFFSGRTDQAASDCTDDRSNDTAFAATDGAAANAANHCACSAADRGFGAFDFHRTQCFDGTHANGLHPTRLVTGVGVTGQARLATSEQHRHRGKGSNQQNRLTHSINSKETDVH
ncbi:hypothetical protein D9M73_146640 [compost metagenome]